MLRLLLERRQHRLEAAPLGLPRGARLRPHRAGDERPVRGVRCTSTTRRTSPRWSSGPRPAACRPSPAWTSSSSTTCSSCRRTTTNRDANRVQEVSRDLARPEGPRPRAVGARHRPVAALPPAGDARVEGAAPVGPARVRRDRAGRGPRRFLWREKEKAGEDADIDGEVINVKLAKHRNGPTGDIQLWFRKSQTRFQSYAGQRYAEV